TAAPGTGRCPDPGRPRRVDATPPGLPCAGGSLPSREGRRPGGSCRLTTAGAGASRRVARPRSRRSWECLPQPEPVETMWPEGEEVRQLTYGREPHASEQLYRLHALEPPQVQLNRLGEPRQVVDAQHDVVPEHPCKRQDRRVGAAQVGEVAERERRIGLANL